MAVRVGWMEQGRGGSQISNLKSVDKRVIRSGAGRQHQDRQEVLNLQPQKQPPMPHHWDLQKLQETHGSQEGPQMQDLKTGQKPQELQ